MEILLLRHRWRSFRHLKLGLRESADDIDFHSLLGRYAQCSESPIKDTGASSIFFSVAAAFLSG